jgi:hypothetical protein
LDDTVEYNLSKLAQKGSHARSVSEHEQQHDINDPVNLKENITTSSSFVIHQLLSRYDTSSSKIYTKRDLRMLVQRARHRGIEVVPEIDMPAHSR